MQSRYPFTQIDPDKSLIITASQRLARQLRQNYNQYQASLGKKAWSSLQVMPWGAWQDWCWQLLAEVESTPRVLTALQSEYIWQNIVEHSEYNNYLLQTRATAKKAQQAWQQLQQWQLTLEADQVWDLDHKAFYYWQKAYQEKLSKNNWLDSDLRTNYLNQKLGLVLPEINQTIYHAGFEQITPQQQTHFDLLANSRKVLKLKPSNDVDTATNFKVQTYDSAQQELRQAVIGAREFLLENYSANWQDGINMPQCTIVVPELEKHKALLESILWQELSPTQFQRASSSSEETQTNGSQGIYDISLGEPLAEQPIIHCASLLLKLLGQRVTKSELQCLLLSPYFAIDADNLALQQRIEKQLKANPKEHWNFEAVAELLARYEDCQDLVEKLQATKALVGTKRNIRQWIQLLPAVLKSIAWTEMLTLDSREHQVEQTFFDTLNQLQQFHLLFEKQISFESLLQLINTVIDNKDFHQELPKAPIQIIGLLETVGLEFDKIWLTGANNQTLPQAPNPNPFLPQTLLRQFSMPGSSNAREWRYAKKIFQSMQQGCEDFICSYASQEGDSELLPSPLLHAGIRSEDTSLESDSSAPQFVSKLLDKSYQSTYQDNHGLPLLGTESATKESIDIKGGTGFFKAQINCPFQAYARYRLSAHEFDETEEGLSPIERGNLVHQILEDFWNLYPDSSILKNDSGEGKNAQELQQLIEPVISKVVEACQQDIFFLRIEKFAEIERQRLLALLVEALQVEQKRPAFREVQSELVQKISISGLNFKMKIDRMDNVGTADAKQIMITDYKTGKPSKKSLTSSPPSEPQLPLYAISQEESVAGVAFFSINQTQSRYIGLADDPAHVNAKRADKISLDDYIESWRKELEQVAESIKSGNAKVAPNSCDYCDYQSFCRINQRQEGLLKQVEESA